MSRILLLLSLLCSVIYSQWMPVEITSHKDKDFSSVHFINRTTGWAVGTGLVIKSTDGGLTWTSTQLITKEPLTEIYFLNETTGFIIGRLGTILKSTDGGGTWKSKPCPVIGWLTDISFIDQNTGYIAAGGDILKSTDGGETWEIVYSWKPSDIFDHVALVSINTFDQIIIAVANNLYYTKTGAVITSSDDGNNWEKIDVSFTTQIADAFFIDRNHGWIGEELSGVSRSTNGGADWTNSAITWAGLNSLFFVDKLNGWVTFSIDDQSMIYNTTDGGVNWNLQLKETGEGYYGIFFIDPMNGWASGPDGIILKTTNGGRLTSDVVDESVAQQFSLLQNYPNPFNPVTTIRYSITEGGLVSLKMYDLLGREITTLVNKEMSAGEYSAEFDAGNVSSGVYLYKLRVGNNVLSRKMMVVK